MADFWVSVREASLSTLATYLKGSAPGAIADALERGTFQQLLDLRRTLHLSNATIGYLQAFVQSSRNPTKVGRHSPTRHHLYPAACLPTPCLHSREPPLLAFPHATQTLLSRN